MTEVWKDVVGFEGMYEVSDLGRIKSLKTYSKNSPILKSSGRGSRCLPYRFQNLRKNGKQYVKKVAVMVIEAFVGPRPHGMDVCHNNGNCQDDRLVNLRYDTRQNNCIDRERHKLERQA